MREGMFLPLIDDTSRGYAYYEKVEFVPHLLTTRRLCYTLMIAMKSARGFCSPQQKRTLTKLYDRVSSALQENSDFSAEDLDLCLSYGHILRPRFNPERIEYLLRCAVEKIELKVLYDTPETGEKERNLRPLNVRKIRNDWVAFCWDSLSKEIRRFSLGRMKTIDETGERFERPPFRLEDYTTGAFDIYTGPPGAPMRDVKIYFTKKKAHIIRENDVNCEVARHDTKDGGLVLHLQLTSFVDLLSFLGEFRGEAVPLEPADLVEEYACDLQKAMAAVNAVRAGEMKVEYAETQRI
jgi:predicted DNA-binding transcriptional regulator YafY